MQTRMLWLPEGDDDMFARFDTHYLIVPVGITQSVTTTSHVLYCFLDKATYWLKVWPYLLYCFLDKATYWLKVAMSYSPCLFDAPVKRDRIKISL